MCCCVTPLARPLADRRGPATPFCRLPLKQAGPESRRQVAETMRILDGDAPRQRVIVSAALRLKRGQTIDACKDIEQISVRKRGRWGAPHRIRVELTNGKWFEAEASDRAIGQLLSWSANHREPESEATTQSGWHRHLTPRESLVAILVVAVLSWTMYSLVGAREASPSGATATSERQDGSQNKSRSHRQGSPSENRPHRANDVAFSELRFSPSRADEGKRVFIAAIAEYPQLHSFYSQIDKRNVPYGFPAGLALPADAWALLSTEQQIDIGHYLSRESPINGWHITIGAVDGPDILADSTAMTSADWELREEPDERFSDAAERRHRSERESALRQALAEGEPGLVTGIAKTMLYDEAREHVRASLRNPSSARFASPVSDPATAVTRLPSGDVEVKGWVEAENGFGGTVRRYWTASIRPSALGHWSIVKLDTTP